MSEALLPSLAPSDLNLPAGAGGVLCAGAYSNSLAHPIVPSYPSYLSILAFYLIIQLEVHILFHLRTCFRSRLYTLL